MKAEIAQESPGFARLMITDDAGRSVKVELGVDWRAHPPVRLEIGPVLHQDDAVANKVAALYGRAEVRDFVDVDAVLRSGRYTMDDLSRLAADADPGFDKAMFAMALSALRRIPDQALAHHGLTADDITKLRERFRRWERSVDSKHP